jgi:hypothetical protein
VPDTSTRRRLPSPRVLRPAARLARSRPRALLVATARLWRDLSAFDLGLGLYHPATIGYRVAEPGALHAVALAAPLGTLLGRPYRLLPPDIPPLDRLGRVPPHPSQTSDTPASRETEAALFAVYALDLLAESPMEGAPREWDDFVAWLAAHQRAFREPDLASGLAQGLADASSDDLVLRVAALAAEGR